MAARRGFGRSWATFRDLRRDIADGWQAHDNSGLGPVLRADFDSEPLGARHG